MINFCAIFCSLVVLEVDQWVEDVMFSIEEVIIFVVLFFLWLKGVLIRHFQGTVSVV